MSIKIKHILPDTLSGPRSFFTDIDPTDPNYDKRDAITKLKLQLLTKERIVIAASSLFHDIGLEIFTENKELAPALEDGIIVPAIRNEFDGIKSFFDNKTGYSEKSKTFFTQHVGYSVPWDLMENSNWFKQHFFEALSDPISVLRIKGGLKEQQASDITNKLNDLISSEDESNRFFQRKHIQEVGKEYPVRLESFLNNYANLVYRLSGSRVVNSEGHFPQSNLTKLEIVENERILSDENIFWDIYAETVFSYLGTVIRLNSDRLNNMGFSDILKMRRSFFDIGFSHEYDNLIALVKQKADISDPDRLILHMHEISQLAIQLKDSFSAKIRSELSIVDSSERENALWQIGNALCLLASPTIGLIVGALSALKSIPEITAPISKPLANAMNARLAWMREFVNLKIGWSGSQRKSFLDAYKSLASYGLK